MKAEYLKALKFSEESIIEDLLVTDVIPGLRTCESFTLEDQEIILHEVTSKAKAMKLLDTIRDKDNQCFEKFLDILRDSNEDLAEQMQIDLNGRQRNRRLSLTEVGEILVKGGVPDLPPSYIPRKQIEDHIIKLLKSNLKKPILVHGIVGCGKSSLVINLLKTDQLFSDRFNDCCWLSIGNIREKDVIKTLTILQKKLNASKTDDLSVSNIPEILVENIKKRLRDMTTLLILDDVWSDDIMKYFAFQCNYIVISRRPDIFPHGIAELVEIPDRFDKNDCQKLLEYFAIDKKVINVIIEKSHYNLMNLSMMANMIKSNSDCIRFIDGINAQVDMDKILKEYINILDADIRQYYEMLVILQSDHLLTLDMLSIYWNVNTNKALEIAGKLCNKNFLFKKRIPEYAFNMYGIYNPYLEYLKETSDQLKNYQDVFIERYLKKYSSWLAIDHTDPFFIKLYVTILSDRKDFKKLQKLYTDFEFIAAKIVICGIDDLMFDYERHNWFESNANCMEFEQFLMKYVHKFIKLPDNQDIILKIGKIFTTLIQLGLYEMRESATYKLAYESMKLSKRNDFWNWINPQKTIKAWEVSDGENISQIDVNQDAILLASENGQIRLLQYSSGKCIFNYKISNHDIILVKFIDRLKFLVIDSSGKHWKFDPMTILVPNLNSLGIHDDYDNYGDYDDDNDFRSSPRKAFNNSIDFLDLKDKFQRILIQDFTEKCHSNILDIMILENKKIKRYSKAFLFSKQVVLLGFNETSTYVGIYDSDFKLLDDFHKEFIIEKLIFQNDYFYALTNRGEIFVLNECGSFCEHLKIENQVIIDFCVNDSNVFCAVQNKIYIYPELLFSIDTLINIRNISMSPDKSLLALSLTTDSVQLWNYSSETPELVHFLNDSQFMDVYFSQKSDSLITIGQTNVAKWDIVSLDNNNQNNDNNNNNENENQVFLSDHQKMFALQQLSPDKFVLMTQTFKNNLKFYEFYKETFNCKILVEDLKATCYNTWGAIGFIGFTNGLVKIYDLNTHTKEQEIDTGSEVVNMYAFQMSKSVMELVTCQSPPHGIMSYQLDYKSWKLLKHWSLNLPENALSVKNIFKRNEKDLILAIRCSSSCVIYKLNEDKLFNEYSFNLNSDLVDADFSEDYKYLCLIATSGQVKIWRSDSSVSLFDMTIENCGILRKCKFRPMKESHKFKTIAVINDQAVVYLVYFTDNELKMNMIIEDSPSIVRQIPDAMIWSKDSNYLLVGDYDIRKWKVPLEPRTKKEVKLPLTKLQTFFGGIHSIQLTMDIVCTIDQQGFLYVLKKID